MKEPREQAINEGTSTSFFDHREPKRPIWRRYRGLILHRRSHAVFAEQLIWRFLDIELFVVNLATIHELERQCGIEIDPRRF